MANVTIKNGVMTSTVSVQVTRDYLCSCGAKSVLTVDWPEGVTVNAPVNFNIKCPSCGANVALPSGHHYVENYRLLSK